MAVWRDPYLPTIAIPDDLQHQWFQLGSAKYQLLPAQFELLSAQEEAVAYVGGLGSGKTRVGTLKASILSMFPNNRGVVGRHAGSDLEETAQRDLLDFLSEAELLKEAPNTRNHRAIVYCVDPVTGENLGYTSEISFVHLDDPDHLKGRHIGWDWIDEGSEVEKKAFSTLVGRLRWPAFRGRYQSIVTGNPEGMNWLYDHFFNEELLTKMICGKPGCSLSAEDCNRAMRRKRRGIHSPTYQNYFLPPDYIENMISTYSEEERRRYLDADFNVFTGQIFKEFLYETHVLGVA